MKKQLLTLFALCFLAWGAGAQTIVNMPEGDGAQTTVNVTDPVTFYDAGGEAGDIPKYRTNAVTFAPKPGEKIQIVFETINLGVAQLVLFDGKKILDHDEEEDEYTIPWGGRKVSFTGTKANQTVVSDSPDGKLTVCFSNANGIAPGWKATVSSLPATPLPADEVRIGISPSPQIVGNTPLNFYDDGGKKGKILQDFNGAITFKPAELGKKVKITFNSLKLFNTSSTGKNDVLNVYSGSTATEENLLATLLNEATPVVLKSTADDGSLTVTLKSVTGIPADGFEAVVTQFVPAKMTFNTVQLAQQTTGTVCAGDKNQAILSVNVKTTDDLTPLSAEKFVFTSNGTFAQVEKATLYYTGKNNSFATSHKVGEANITADGFEISCSTPQVLFEGNNYFWLAYDLKAGATNGQTIDAGCTAVTVSGTNHPVATPQPEGNRSIKNEYISTVGSFQKNVFGDWTFTHTVQSQYNSNYKAEMGDQIVTFVPATSGKIIEINFADFDVVYASNTYQTRAKFQIFSGKTTSGEKLWEVNADNKSTGPGKTIRSKSPDGALTIVFNANTTYNHSTAKGWHATVNEYLPQAMQFSGSTAFQTNSDILKPGALNQDIIGIEILTTGDQSPLAINQFVLNLKGSHDKIKKVSIFSTGADKAFDTKTLLGESAAPTSSNLSIAPTVPVSLAEGKNYFWVAYDMKDVLASDQIIDAALESLKINNELKTPTVGDPDGSRVTKNELLLKSGNNGELTVTQSLLFFDDGGSDGKYSLNFDGQITFLPSGNGKVVKLNFEEFKTQYNHYLYVYEGKEVKDEKLIGKYASSTFPKSLVSKSDDGAFTLRFVSGKVNAQAGWKIRVESYTPRDLFVESLTTSPVSTADALRGTSKLPMMKLEVKVSGDRGHVSLNDFKFASDGTTTPSDIRLASLFYTGLSSGLVPEQPVATATSGSPFVFVTTEATKFTASGTYHFWLTYDVAPNAVAGNKLKATLQSVSVNSQPTAPDAASKAAERSIKAGFKGEYTIGTSGNYKTFEAAVAAMQGGVEGPVTFKVAAGNYAENIKIQNIAGASETNPIRFVAASGRNDDVIISGGGYSEPPHGEQKYGMVAVEGTPYVSFENITFAPTNQSFPHVLHILNGSRHFTLRNSVLKAETVSASFGINLFKMENTKKDEDGYNNDYVTIENNQLRGGYIALNISGTGYVALQKERGAVVRNNIVNNAGSKGIYLSDETDALLDNNTIISSETKKKSYIAIDVFRSKGRLVIRNNKIVNNQTAYSTGINLRNEVSGTVEQPALVYNNSIAITQASDVQTYGIDLQSDCSNIHFFYNSVLISGTQGHAFCVSKNYSELKNIVLQNNLFQNHTTLSLFNFNRDTQIPVVTFANNVYYTKSGKYLTKGADNFAAWLEKSKETASHEEEAEFISASDLQLKKQGGLNTASVMSSITTDADGKLRNPTKPTVGAYEYETIVAVKPEMIAGYPKTGNVTYNSLQVLSKWSQSGKLYTVVLKKDAPAASEQDLLAGTAVELSKNQDYTSVFEGLEEEVEYRVYFLFVTALGAKSDILTSEVIRTPKHIFALDVKLPEMWATVAAGVTEKIFPVVKGGIYPYTYEWYNKMNEKISTDSVLTVSADRSQQYHLTVKTADKQSLTLYTDLVVTGKSYVATFEDNYLAPESYWWRKETEDMESIFYSGSYSFTNTYVKEWSSWGGFAYSNETATDFDPNNLLKQQFRSVTGKGAQDSKTFAVVYTFGSKTEIGISNNPEGEIVPGVFITNAAYTYHSMTKGDTFVGDPFKKGDFLKIIFTGKTASNGSSTLEYYLADYRSANEAEHYMLTDWKWIDLSPLGKVKSITIRMDGSRKGNYGLNTPAYFCMDNLGATRPENTAIESISLLSVHPNPFKDHLSVYASREAVASITDLSGRVLMNFSLYPGENQIDTSSLPAGFYLLRSGSQSVKLMK